jgi:hypothetical protein
MISPNLCPIAERMTDAGSDHIILTRPKRAVRTWWEMVQEGGGNGLEKRRRCEGTALLPAFRGLEGSNHTPLGMDTYT